MGAAYPFQVERGLSSRGVFIGRDVHSGGSSSYDPWALYPDTITGHNLAIFGVLGSRKSSLCKTYCARQVIFGRQVWVLDPKPESGGSARRWAACTCPCGRVATSASTRWRR
jgi:hypothetical protein